MPQIGDPATGTFGDDPPADPVTGLEHDDAPALDLQQPRRRQARDPGADDHNVELFVTHRHRMPDHRQAGGQIRTLADVTVAQLRSWKPEPTHRSDHADLRRPLRLRPRQGGRPRRTSPAAPQVARGGARAGNVLTCGPYPDGTGALILLRAHDLAAAEVFLANDPFHAHSAIAAVRVTEWVQVYGPF